LSDAETYAAMFFAFLRQPSKPNARTPRCPLLPQKRTFAGTVVNTTVQSAHKEQAPMLDITAAAKPTAPKTITTKHLAYALAEQHQLTKKQGLEMMEELIGMITKHLKKGERVKITGLGILQVRNRAARMGRNPATGEPIHIKASKKVAFRASKDLKLAI
jgi:DNA-binding protein HU-beta